MGFDLRAMLLDWLDGPEADPEPEPEPDPLITVYTVAGTGNYNARVGKANFPAQVVALLDPTKFRWEPIWYPAMVPFTGSVAIGVANCVNKIKARPGRFVLVGFSQGSMVISQVYEEIQSGELADRDADFLAGVAMGNPCRKLNHTFPGYTLLGSHGIAEDARRLVTVDANRWWDMAIPNDIVADIRDDLFGEWATTLFMAMWGGGGNVAQTVKQTVQSSPVDLRSAATQLLGYIGVGSSAPHTQYATFKPLAGSDLTCVELAAQWLNSLAAA
ncbi:hypothetical protein ACK12G_29340 [Mycolicibacterium wolinskyi]|uniref:hypothetical protein n=1 Tax=Mycolicibacterium wolinskyi TaxID=59750 RepID=UPI003917A884